MGPPVLQGKCWRFLQTVQTPFPKELQLRWQQRVSSGPYCWVVAGWSVATRIPQTARPHLAGSCSPSSSSLPATYLGVLLCSVPRALKPSTLMRVCKHFLKTNEHHYRRHCTFVQEGHVSPCKEKIRANHKETTGIEAAPWPHWSSCIHPPSKQLFVVHMYNKHVARGRWCCNINTSIENSSVKYHFSGLQKGSFFLRPPPFLIEENATLLKQGEKTLLCQISQHQRKQKEDLRPKWATEGFGSSSPAYQRAPPSPTCLRSFFS